MKLIGVDVGGTFTDLIITDTGTKNTHIHKVPTTPDDPSVGVTRGILELCKYSNVLANQIDHVFHGTTIATNAVLEYEGSETGMITNQGYRDILHIGRHQRPENYSIMQDIPWQSQPLVARRNRLTVKERITPPDGKVLTELDQLGVKKAAKEFKKRGIKSIAVCFLFSYINPNHEEAAKKIINEIYPEAFVTTSAKVAPQFREFERFTTAAMNAFIGPKVRDYVQMLEQRLKKSGLNADLHIMGSNGGVATAQTVSDLPVITLLSGPAAGVLGGAWSAARAAKRKVITFDVGGTSADIGIVIDGKYSEATSRDTWIGGYPVLVPMIDIGTIGAGGGSIAHVDKGGAFKVGPKSSGSKPGPACYLRGGKLPTDTDANLSLGRLDPENFLGGEMRLDRTIADKVINSLAKELGIKKNEAAEGILTIINSNMANAIRAKTVQKGLDPREFSLVSFGGAGPLHGAEVADMLNIPEVIIPPYPGITSAEGLLTTDLKYDQIKTEFQVNNKLDLKRLNRDFKELSQSLFEQYKADGISASKVKQFRFGDLRYVGQGYELRVPISDGILNKKNIEKVWSAFHKQHQQEYGHFFADSPIEIVNIRLTGVGIMPKISAPKVKKKGTINAAIIKIAPTVFRINKKLKTIDTKFYDRNCLPIDKIVRGPAIILQKDTTTVVPPNWTAKADKSANLILTKINPK